MVFSVIVMLAAIVPVWFVRTPRFGAHRGRRSNHIGQSGRGPEGSWQ
jgi:hypothetical protein